MLVLEAPGVELQLGEIEIEEIDPASFGLIARIHVAGRGAPEAHAMGALRTLVCATTPTCALASANPDPTPTLALTLLLPLTLTLTLTLTLSWPAPGTSASSVLGVTVQTAEEPTFTPDAVEVDGTVDASDGALLCLI